MKNFNLVVIEGYPIIEMKFLDQIYDLHNAAEFYSISYNFNDRLAEITWYYWLNSIRLGRPYIFKFKNVNSFEVKERDSEMPFSEDDCLEQISLLEGGIEFKFQCGMVLRIIAKSAEIIH